MREEFNIILDAIRSPRYMSLLYADAGANDVSERGDEDCIHG